jgi:hypothetical protein
VVFGLIAKSGQVVVVANIGVVVNIAGLLRGFWLRAVVDYESLAGLAAARVAQRPCSPPRGAGTVVPADNAGRRTRPWDVRRTVMAFSHPFGVPAAGHPFSGIWTVQPTR